MKKENASIESRVIANHVKSVVAALIGSTSIRRAVKYLNNHFVVRATRQFKHDGRNSRTTIILTYGVPNYSERRFIHLAMKAGEPFPIKKLQLQYWPKGNKNKR